MSLGVYPNVELGDARKERDRLPASSVGSLAMNSFCGAFPSVENRQCWRFFAQGRPSVRLSQTGAATATAFVNVVYKSNSDPHQPGVLINVPLGCNALDQLVQPNWSFKSAGVGMSLQIDLCLFLEDMIKLSYPRLDNLSQ